jgi:hypothetical protein
MLRKSALLIFTSLLVSCSRPETPTYFSKVTGLRLCADAKVHNVNAQAPDMSPGFDSIYIVDVTGKDNCLGSLLAEVSFRIGKQCSTHLCSGNDRRGEFFSAERRGSAVRIIYGT